MAVQRIEIEGMDKLLRTLDSIKDKGMKTAIRAGMRAGMTEVAKEVRRQITTEPLPTVEKKEKRQRIIKSIKKTVGTRLKKYKGITQAKIGFGAGKKRMSKAAGAENREARKKAGKSGVGIGAQNIHWFVLGTDNMDPLIGDVLQRAVRISKGAMLQKNAIYFQRALERETRKLRKRL